MTDLLDKDGATWLLERLRLIGVIPAGEDAPAVRQAILDAGIQHNVFGGALPRGVEDYGQRFERVFGEPLVQHPNKNGDA